MPQFGVHAVLGLALRRPLSKTRSLVWGIFIGNVFPDIDMFLTGIVYLFDEKLGRSLHRTFMHSWLTALVLLLIFVLLAFKDKKYISFGFGLFIGMAFVHIFLDIFFWFESIDVFWPLSLFGVTQPIDVWKNIDIPNWIRSFMVVLEFLAFGVYYSFLRYEAKRLSTNREFNRTLMKVEWAHYVAFLVYCILILYLPYKSIVLYSYILLLLVSGPVFFWTALKMKKTIEMQF